MKYLNNKHGFTIVEVALFLALSGFLMVGIIVGANISISRQRYNDAVNNFADFLRGAYTDTLNVSNDNFTTNTDGSTALNGGRSQTAVYGKLITFGESEDGTHAEKTIYAYDVVGKAVSSSATTSSTVLAMLQNELGANIIQSEKQAGSIFSNSFYRIVTYNIPWDGEAQKPDKSLFSGAILIVRSPTTGGIRTYVYEGEMKRDYSFHKAASAQNNQASFFTRLLAQFHEGRLDLCLESPDNNLGNRRDFRILERANNTTGVLLVGLDDLYSSDNPEGSKCGGQ